MMSVDVVLAVLVQWPGQYLSTCEVSSFALKERKYIIYTDNQYIAGRTLSSTRMGCLLRSKEEM